MTREDIDILWNKALGQAIKEGEQFTRYHFASLVAAEEREACAKVCEAEAENQYDNMDIPLTIAADLIRERGQE